MDGNMKRELIRKEQEIYIAAWGFLPIFLSVLAPGPFYQFYAMISGAFLYLPLKSYNGLMASQLWKVCFTISESQRLTSLSAKGTKP